MRFRPAGAGEPRHPKPLPISTMPNSNEKPLPPAGEAMPAPASIPVDSVSEINDQLASTELSDQDDAKPPADAAVGGTKPKEDSELWKPHPPTQECPICMVPVPLNNSKSMYWACCGKTLCNACCEEDHRALRVTNRKRDKKKLPPLEHSCAFCRRSLAKNNAELSVRYEERIGKDDTRAMVQRAYKLRDGSDGLRKDKAKAIELLNKAADLGSAEAIRLLGTWAVHGWFGSINGSISDKQEAKEYFEDAMVKGDVVSRNNLASLLADEGNYDLAIKHWHLAAAAGDDFSINGLMHCFRTGKLSKPNLEKALRAHKAASDEMKSEERERWDASQEAEAGDDERLAFIYQSYYAGYTNAKELKVALKAYRAGDWRAVEMLLTGKARAHG